MFESLYNYWYADQIKAEAEKKAKLASIEKQLVDIEDPSKKATAQGAAFFVRF